MVVATPAYVASRLVKGLDDDALAALAKVTYGPYVVAGLLTREHERMPWDDIYAIAVSGKSFNMFFNTVNTLRGGIERQPGGASPYMARATARGHSWSCQTPKSGIASLRISMTSSRYSRTLWRSRSSSVGSGIPYSAPGRHSVQQTLERLAQTVSLAGDYLGERGGMEIAALSGIEAATGVQRRLEDDK